jgi:hypothetical protein
MNTSAQAQMPRQQNWGTPHAQGQVAQVNAATQECRPLTCFGCGKLGHIVAHCPNQEYRHAAVQQTTQRQWTCFSCEKKGHMAKDCLQRKCITVNIMDAKEDPLDYPVTQPKPTSQCIAQIKHGVRNLSDEEYEELKASFGNNLDFQIA